MLAINYVRWAQQSTGAQKSHCLEGNEGYQQSQESNTNQLGPDEHQAHSDPGTGLPTVGVGIHPSAPSQEHTLWTEPCSQHQLGFGTENRLVKKNNRTDLPTQVAACMV